MRYISHTAESSGCYSRLKVVKMRVISVWMDHGSIATIGSVFSGLVGSPVTHWWVEIETEDPDIWYCAQFKKINGVNDLYLRK